ncbi:MAG: calcium-binding protein [Xenococcus sp. (in: cyanobacteria)]
MLNTYVDALGDVIFFNYSHAPSVTSVDTYALTLAQSGETIAEAEAEAFFYYWDLSRLISESSGVGSEGAFEGSAANEAAIIASFSVAAGATFSFDFSTDLSLEAKEIDNPDVEYTQALLNIGFLVLDTSDPNNIQLLDYGDIWAYLISSEQIADLQVDFTNNFILEDYLDIIDIDGDNGGDLISSTNLGTYQRTFDNDTNLTLLKLHNSAVEWLGDSFIGNLGPDFIYGTIRDDRLLGTGQDDKLYASFGDDLLFGRNGNDLIIAGNGNDRVNGGNGDDRLFGDKGDDNLNGSNGNDQLFGGAGDDSLSGSNNNDLLEGGSGNDTLTGGFGTDQFLYKTSRAFNSAQVGVDLITDLEVNRDRIVLSQRTFTALTLTTDGSINPDEFEVVANDDFAAVSEAFITYSTSTGNLFYNQNGSDDGLGQGAQFATLQNSPTLSATNFLISE